MKPYSERDAVAVGLQADHGSAKAFEQERGCKSTRLQQRRQAGGPRQGARADDGGTVALCLPTPRLTQVSLLARPRPRSVLVCMLAPYLSSTAQPNLRLHPVGGRNLPDAAWEPTFSGCPAAACGSSMAAHRSCSRRRPWCHRGVRSCPERAALEVLTAVERRTCCPPSAGRSTRIHSRAGGHLAPL